MTVSLELHPEIQGRRYTLRGIFRNRQDAAYKLQALAEEGLDAVQFEAIGPRGSALFFVAARHNVQARTRTGLPHEKGVDWVATAYAVRVFRMQVRSARKSKGSVRWYKDLNVHALRSALSSISWKGRRLDVAGRILSNLILTHPFPNANHRTCLSLVRGYLKSVGVEWPGYSLKGRGQVRLHRETHGFFRDSKYFLQLLRHMDLVRVAYEEGFTHLHIGPNADAEIRAADLVLGTEEIRASHEALCRRTIRNLAAEELRESLDAETRSGLRAWVDWMKKGRG